MCPGTNTSGVVEPEKREKGMHAEEHPGLGDSSVRKASIWGGLEVPDGRDW